MGTQILILTNTNATLETIGTHLVNGYDVQGLETIYKSRYKLYTMNPDTQGLFTIDIATGITNIISSTSHISTEPFQFLAFDPNDHNIVNGGFRNVHKIDKLHGNYTVTSYEAGSHRGFIILDQDTCTQIECTSTTNQPITRNSDFRDDSSSNTPQSRVACIEFDENLFITATSNSQSLRLNHNNQNQKLHKQSFVHLVICDELRICTEKLNSIDVE